MKDITITLKKDEILYDVENTAYLVGNSRATGDNYEQVSNIQNSGEEGDRNFILRAIDTAFNEVKKNLSRYIDETKATDNNDLIDAENSFILNLKVVDMFNEASTESLKSSTHDYITSAALRDWFGNVKPDEMPIYEARVIKAHDNMLSALYRKKAPKRPTP